MPAWISIAATDLNDYLVAEQVEALREEALAEGQADPFTNVATDVIRKVRAYIASNPQNVVDATELTIPPELKLDVCYLIIAPMLGRLGIALTKDQDKQLELAHSTLIALREKKLLVSKPVSAEVPDVQGGSAVVKVSGGARQATATTLRNL
ncbi:MAG TPA: hypothetical protein VGE76_16335 [Opitutaceae bacterium]